MPTHRGHDLARPSGGIVQALQVGGRGQHADVGDLVDDEVPGSLTGDDVPPAAQEARDGDALEHVLVRVPEVVVGLAALGDAVPGHEGAPPEQRHSFLQGSIPY